VRPHGGLEVAMVEAMSRTSVPMIFSPPTRRTRRPGARAELGLEPQRHLPDLVEKERALIGGLELPRLLPIRARECALLVTEQLRLEQLTGKRGAVHFKNWRWARGDALWIARATTSLPTPLSPAATACVGGSHLRDQIPDRLHLALLHRSRPSLMYNPRGR